MTKQLEFAKVERQAWESAKLQSLPRSLWRSERSQKKLMMIFRGSLTTRCPYINECKIIKFSLIIRGCFGRRRTAYHGQHAYLAMSALCISLVPFGLQHGR
uniref:Uncharacterized protein n=1 Tax=Arundo donax TaxID=35708 RepID=A0A0A9ASA5_ARUDO